VRGEEASIIVVSLVSAEGLGHPRLRDRRKRLVEGRVPTSFVILVLPGESLASYLVTSAALPSLNLRAGLSTLGRREI